MSEPVFPDSGSITCIHGATDCCAEPPVVRKHPLALCETCPLYGCKGPVNGEGPDGPVQIAVVGEAPGFHEATLLRPFIGPSGDVLNEILRNNDIDREKIWVTNTVMCRPDDNATPSTAAIEACKPRLYDELVDANPEYVIAMGAVAAKAFGQSGSMAKLRVGPPKDVVVDATPDGSDPYHFKLINTWHAAYAMRLPDALPSIDLDFSKAVKGTTATPWREPQLIVVDDREMSMLAIGDLWEMPGPFAVDIETGVEKDDADTDHPDQRPLLCVGVEYEPDKVVVFGKSVMDDPLILKALSGLFGDKPLIMHNGKSDVAGMFPVMGETNLVYDTMLEHYVLDERTGGHSLGQLGIELLGTPDWKAWVKPYLKAGKQKNFADIPDDLLYRYNAVDCAVTGRLHRMFWPELEKQGRVKAHDHMVAAARQLVYPEMDGIGFDMPYSLDLTGQLQDEISQLAQEITDYLGVEINPGSPQQLIRLFTERDWHVPIAKKQKGGRGPTTAAPALNQAMLAGKYDEDALGFLDLLFRYRDLTKDDGTFVRGMQKRAVDHSDEEGDSHFRIHTTYTLHVATTGRLSSKDPNLQNIKDKKHLRRQFVAADGNLLLQGDYSQVEGRVIAVLSGDEYLCKLFGNAERDIFDEICIALEGKVIKPKRRLHKTFFYGYSYGRTAHGIANAPEFRMDVRDAQRQLDAFKALIPQVGEWQEETWQRVQDQGYLETTFGRRRHFPLITRANANDVKNEALAFMPQSTASDICLRAFTQLRPDLEESFRGEPNPARIRLTIHDAIVVETPESELRDTEHFMRTCMEASGNRWSREQGSDIPFAVAFKSGPSWDKLGD